MIEDRQPGSVALGLPRLIPGIVFESPDVIPDVVTAAALELIRATK
jgi:hypothetical protein